MPKVFVTDEVQDSYTQDVLASGAAEVASVYKWIGIASGTASGVLLADGDYILHTVIIGETGSGILILGDHLSADGSAATVVGMSASAVAHINCFTRGSYLFDCFIDNGLQYRLSAVDTPGIRVTYQVI